MVPYYHAIRASCILTVWFITVSFASKLEVLYQWKQVDFTYPSQQARETALRSRKFMPENCVILDVDVWQPNAPKLQEDKLFFSNGHNSNSNSNNNNNNNVKPNKERRIFVSLPRFKQGIPVTLATVSNQKRSDSYLLAPFPNWGAQREGNCEGVTSAYRTMIDTCGRLWVIDSGKVENFSPTSRKVCRPKVIAYDLNNGDRLIGRYPIPDNQLEDDSLLVTLTVDVRDANCKDTFIYIADVTAFKLIIYDIKNNESWRVSNNYFYPFPLHGHFDIAGTRFNLMDGLLALALGPLKNNDRHLYFHSLASVREGSVLTSVLRNRTLFEDDSDAAWQSFSISEPVRSSQSASEAMSNSGVMIFGLLSETSLACWNSQTPYTRENIHIIQQNNETLQFPGGVKIIGDSVWIATSELQNYIAETTDANDVKYRILHASLDDLVAGTGCDIRSGGYLVHEIETKLRANINNNNHNHNNHNNNNYENKFFPPQPFVPHSAHFNYNHLLNPGYLPSPAIPKDFSDSFIIPKDSRDSFKTNGSPSGTGNKYFDSIVLPAEKQPKETLFTLK